MKQVVILGSTGSIGTQALEVIDKLDDYGVYALSCGKNIKLLKEQIKKYSPKVVCIEDSSSIKEIKDEFKNLEVLYGIDGLVELAKRSNYDIFLVATNGVVALRATIEAIKNKKQIALANKETLVMAGEIVSKIAKENNINIIPVDSEHSAVLQCLGGFDNKFSKRLYLTASGGPFLNNSRKDMEKFSALDALKHPRWNMGKKITIDCSTLVNKGFEVIEAHYLFDYDYENIKVVIHPQSLVHSMVEFVDGSFIAQMGVASMHIPIQYALTYPKRVEGIKTDSFDIFNQKLEFYKPDYDKFPLLKLTLDCAKKGGIMNTVLNAANEVAVYKFLRGEIKFLDIEKIIFKTIEGTKNIINPSLDEIFEADKLTRIKLK